MQKLVLVLFFLSGAALGDPKKLVPTEYLDHLPKFICSSERKKEQCMKYIATYVVARFINANNDYYQNVLDEMTKQQFKDLRDSPNYTYQSDAYNDLWYKNKRELIDSMVDRWLLTGQLPTIAQTQISRP